MQVAAEYAVKIGIQENVQSALKQMDGSMSKLGGASGGLGNAFGKISSQFPKMSGGLQGIAAEVPMIGEAFAMLSNPIGMAVAAVTVLGTAVAFVGSKAIEAAKDYNVFDSAMHKINVTAQLTESKLTELGEGVARVAANSTLPDALKQAPEGLNKIMSAGITETKLAMQTLDDSMKAAKAGFTTVEVAAGAAVSVMNSSGIKDSTRVYDVLFATLNKGNAEFEDISNYLPKIIPGAKAAGFGLEQTAAAFAQLTANGLKSEAASTALENSFKALSDTDIIKGTKSKLGLAGIGVSVYDAQGKTKSLIDIVGQLKTKMQGLTDEQRTQLLNQVGFDTEASRGMLSLMSDMGAYSDTLKFVTDSQGQLGEAVKNSASGGDGWILLQNQMAELWRRFGAAVAPVFNQIGSFLGSTIKKMMDWYDSSQILSSGFHETLVGLSSSFTTMWQSIKPFFPYIKTAFSWLSSTIFSIFTTIGEYVITPFLRRLQAVADFIRGISEALKGNFSNAGNAFLDASMHALNFATTGDKKAAAANYKANGIVDIGQMGDNILSGFKSQFDSKKASIMPKGNEGKADPSLLALINGGGKDKKKAAGDGGGGGQGAIRHVTVNITAPLIGNYTIQTTNLQEGMKDVENKIKESLVRLVRDSELSMAEN
jgi:TP901 family phage tail tape measure protein